MSEPRARKRFGQNFLHDAGIIERIVQAIDPRADDHCVEIGPGLGVITRPLAEHSARVDVVEIDRDLVARLEESDWAKDIRIHAADALSFDFSALADTPRTLRLVGNLPYNISTPLLFHLLEHQAVFRDLHVMLQREVVQRMTAAPGTKTYGRLTVALAARCKVEALFVIKPGAFRPAPKVQSAFARLTPLAEPLVSEAESSTFDNVLRAAFGQRRKQLANALGNLLTAEEIRGTGISPTVRAEQLDVDDYLRLTRAVIEAQKQ